MKFYKKDPKILIDTKRNPIGVSSNPFVTEQYRYNTEQGTLERKKISDIGVHICVDDINTATGIILVDLSDTTNFPHSNTGFLCITGYEITISPDVNYAGKVVIGFLENVDETNGDFKPLLCWDLEKNNDQNINQSLVLDSPICGTPGKFLTPGNIDDTTWQTDVALMSPYDNTAPYTTMPGDGDLVMKITRTSGEVSVGVSLKYYSES